MRGRLVLALGLAAVAACFLWFAHAGAAAGARAGGDATVPANAGATAASIVTVHDGDTLWTIAGQVDPSRDPRDVVAKLRKLNALTDLTLRPGQSIRVR